MMCLNTQMSIRRFQYSSNCQVKVQGTEEHGRDERELINIIHWPDNYIYKPVVQTVAYIYGSQILIKSSIQYQRLGSIYSRIQSIIGVLCRKILLVKQLVGTSFICGGGGGEKDVFLHDR